MLSGGSFDAAASQREPVFLCPGDGTRMLVQIVLDIAEGDLVFHRADGTRPEHMGLAEKLKGIAVSVGLIFTGEI